MKLLIPLLFAAVFVHTLAAPTFVSAQEAFHCIDDLSEAELRYRTEQVQRYLDRGKQKSAIWRFGWIGGLTALTATQIGLAIANKNDQSDKVGFALGAVGTGLITFRLSALPMVDIFGAGKMRKHPTDTIEQRRDKLRLGTRMLKESAELQDSFKTIWPHTAGLVYGAVTGTILRVKYGTEARARTLTQFILIPAINSASIVTQPRYATKDWERYRSVACSSHYYEDEAPLDVDALSVELGIAPGGLNLTLQF